MAEQRILESDQIYSRSEVANTAAATDPAAAAILYPLDGDGGVAASDGGLAIEGEGTSEDGAPGGGAGGELAGETVGGEAGGVKMDGAKAGGVAGGDAVGVGVGAEALVGGAAAGVGEEERGDVVGAAVGAFDGAWAKAEAEINVKIAKNTNVERAIALATDRVQRES